MNDKNKYYPTVSQSFALILILVLITFITTMVLAFINRAFEVAGSEFPKTLRDLLLYVIPMGLTCWIAFRQRKTYTNLTQPLSFKGVPILSLLLLLASTVCIGNIVDISVYLLPLPDSGYFKKMMEDLANDATNYHPVVAIFSISLLPGFFEEILFRGIVLDGLLKRYKPWESILISSVLFGLFHLNPFQFVAGLITGLFLGWVYYRTRSLLACMIIHAFNNLGALIEYWLTRQTEFTFYNRMDKQSFTLFVVMTIVALVICIQLLKRQFNKLYPLQH